jgi:N-acetylmuramic acid 6-phosphate (MurNAc-6-P) etherase
MINVQATNDKLRARAVRLVQALSKRDAAAAQAALESTAWRVPAAIEALNKTSRSRAKLKRTGKH